MYNPSQFSTMFAIASPGVSSKPGNTILDELLTCADGARVFLKLRLLAIFDKLLADHHTARFQLPCHEAQRGNDQSVVRRSITVSKG